MDDSRTEDRSTEWKPYVPAPGATPDEVEPLHTGAYDARALEDRFDALIARANAGEHRFARTFRNDLYRDGDGWISVTELEDDFHAMRIALRIAADGTITDAGGRMARRPYDTCPRALDSLPLLVGATVARPGAHRQIKERIPRTQGCLHLVDMVEIAFRAFRIAKGHEIPSGYRGDGTRRTLLGVLPQMRDTCVSFAIRPQGGTGPAGGEEQG